MTAIERAEEGQRLPLLLRLRRHRLNPDRPMAYRLQAGLALNGLRLLRRLPGVNPTVAAPDLRQEKLICRSHRFAFLPVPKVATKSMRHLFQADLKPALDLQPVSLPVPELLAHYPETRDFLKFSFVRNPWSRVVSCYHSKLDQQISLGNLAIMSRYPGLKPHMPFPAFVEWLASPAGSDATADRHWLSQHRLLADEQGVIASDFIGRQESLEEDFAELCGQIGLPDLNLPRKNRSAYRKDPERRSYRDYYDPHLKNLVGDRYAEDIARFGYDF